MAKSPASIALIIYTFLSMWFVGGLSVFHLYLISSNQTTYENFRYRYDRRANPYNQGVFENFKEIFFSSVPRSINKFRSRVLLDEGLSTHSACGGFISPNIGKGAGDIEEARKPVSSDEALGADDLEAGHANEREDKDVRLGNTSPDLERTLTSKGLTGQHFRSSKAAGADESNGAGGGTSSSDSMSAGNI